MSWPCQSGGSLCTGSLGWDAWVHLYEIDGSYEVCNVWPFQVGCSYDIIERGKVDRRNRVYQIENVLIERELRLVGNCEEPFKEVRLTYSDNDQLRRQK